jgi:formate dehydrogenase subunit gamma
MKRPEGIKRFVVAERLAHWLYALFFLIALVSGLLMWFPLTRAWLGAARHDVSVRHGATGFAMIVVPLLLLALLDRRRLRGDIREVDRWSRDDRRWFWAALRGDSLRKREMPPQGRLNAGMKANSILVAAMAVGFAVTGGILLGKAGLPAWLVSRALWLHGFLAICATALFAGHLVHVFGTRHGRGYLQAMIKGRLPEEIARERHALWWEREKAEDPPTQRTEDEIP